MTQKRLWRSVLADLELGLSKANFTAYLQKTTLKGVTQVDETRQIVDVGCPTSFHQSVVEGRYYNQIKEVLDRLTKKKNELRFVVDSSMRESQKSWSTPLLDMAQQPTVDPVEQAFLKSGLKDEFNFESFAVSNSNEMAHAAAVAVSKNPGKAYNPLFLYGGVGVGKTHLMQAVGQNILKANFNKRLIYCTSEEFTNEIIDAIQQKKTRLFKKKFRTVKALLIDDIQFIAGKTTVQEEFFHTFNTITREGGQVIMTSDSPPREISDLEARLRSRFEGGLIIDIQEPSFELRTAILLIKAKQGQIELPIEAAKVIAANVIDTRGLEGMLARLRTESLLRKEKVSLEMAQAVVGKRKEENKKLVGLKPLEVVKEVAGFFHMSPKQIRGPRRVKQVVTARHVAMYLLRHDLGLSLEEVGSVFGGRDHTTVMYAVDKVGTELSRSDSLRVSVEQIRNLLGKKGRLI